MNYHSSDHQPATRLPITAIVLAFNEEVHIGRCINRLQRFVDRIVVVDSFSSDATIEIAKNLGAEVYQHSWKNYADQFQWALDNTNIKTKWTMRIDCDEWLEDGLITEIESQILKLPENITACDLKLKVIFKGKFIRWGGYYNTVLTRLWRTGAADIEKRWMDEHIVLKYGEKIRLHGGDLVDENLKDLTWWTEKHNGYATRQMIDFISLEYPLFNVDMRLRSAASGNGTRRKWRRFLRNTLYGRAPLYTRAVLYFIQRYFLRLGFLDGKRGFVWHFLQGFWFFVLMDAKIDEARTYIKKNGLDKFKEHLALRYGVTDLTPVKPDL